MLFLSSFYLVIELWYAGLSLFAFNTASGLYKEFPMISRAISSVISGWFALFFSIIFFLRTTCLSSNPYYSNVSLLRLDSLLSLEK